MRLWVLRVARGRVRSEWRLLLVVLAVALLAATTVTSLGLLVFASEQGGVRTALSALPASETALEVDISSAGAPIAATRKATDAAIRSLLGGAASFTSSVVAFTEVDQTQGVGDTNPLAYFGDLDGVKSQASLTDGSWAGAVTAGSPVPVTLPETAAHTFHLAVGSVFEVQTSRTGTVATVRVAGIYKANSPRGQYWSRDPLHGRGNDPAYPLPDSLLEQTGDAFGPLIVAPGALDAAGIPAESIDDHYVPNFSRTTVDELTPLLNRLSTADTSVPTHIGFLARAVSYSGNLGEPVQQIASNLIVTRSTVVVVILLLLVLAVAALSQTARLWGDARASERQLMLDRGVSRAQLLALATLEAIVIGALTALVSPFVAELAYRVLAAQPALVAAGMPPDSGLPALAWELAAGVALLFVIVLVLPLLARPVSFVAGEQKKVRQRRGSGLMRSGLDLGLVVVAGVAYWQLQSYRSPVTGGATLAVDPVLVAAPAVVLLAGAFLCVRLIPAASRIMERLGSRARGTVLPLAAWEIGRRSQRPTAAVLLLTIALAVGTFSQSFLATWRQSQVDQASLAVGPPVRVPVDPATVDEQAVLLASGARGKPQPVIRRTATVAGSGATLGDPDTLDGTNAVVLGLTAQARNMINTGRLASEGGAQVEALLGGTPTATTSILLPGDVAGISATVRVGTPATSIAGVSASLDAILEDGNGLLTTVDLGDVPVDGQPHEVSGMLPPRVHGAGAVAPLRFVGLQASILESKRATYNGNTQTGADILVGNLAVLHPASSGGGYSAQPVQPAAHAAWAAEDADSSAQPATTGHIPAGWQLSLDIVIPSNIDQQSATFALVGWPPVVGIPAVVSTSLAVLANVKVGDNLTLVFSQALVTVRVVGTAPLIAGSTDYAQLTSGTASGADAQATDTVVVDQAALERALAQVGQSGPMVDEWWVSVAPGHGQAYLTAHPAGSGALPARSAEVLGLQMQQDPLRIATQAALWLAIAAAALLAAVGFAVHTTATMRSRRTEFAQLRAIGLSRRGLVGLIAAESLLLCLLGTVFGVGVGTLLSWLTGPLVAVSPDGSPAVPSVMVNFPGAAVTLLVVAVIAVLGLVVLLVARAQRAIDPAGILRAGDEA